MPYIQEGKQSAWQAKEPSDGVLVGQAVAGDERAFEALVSRYEHALLNSIRRLRSTLANSPSLALVS
jgi:hypothetical protein